MKSTLLVADDDKAYQTVITRLFEGSVYHKPKRGNELMSTISGANGEAVRRGLVLVAEDDAKMRAVLSRFMSVKGHEVIEAADGSEAVALARKRAPDIVLLDIAMPGKDGLEVLKELVPGLPDTGFIIVTGNEDEALARACLELGAYDYVPKPADMSVLASTVEACLLVRRPPLF